MSLKPHSEKRGAPTDTRARGTGEAFGLLADIGGTNTRLALMRNQTLLPESIKRFANERFPDVLSMLRAYLDEHQSPHLAPQLERACLAVAAPVADGKASMSNRHWELCAQTLGEALGARFVLLNDLQAQGYSLDLLSSAQTTQVLLAPVQPSQPRMVVGLGTGLNIAQVIPCPDGGVVVPASECGYARLPLLDGEARALADALARQHPGVSFAQEELLSGRGLEAAYQHLSQQHRPDKSAAEIVASHGEDPVAAKTLHLVIEALGHAMAGLALTCLPSGGIFLSGSVARALAPLFEPMGFRQAFCQYGPSAEFMAQFPISVITDDFAALTGAARYLDTLPAH